jgi:hypothetical protein
MSKIALLAVAAITVAFVGSVAAEARGRHHHHGIKHHRHVFIHRAPVYLAPIYHDCSYAYAKWQVSGSYYWKKRYFACKGW